MFYVISWINGGVNMSTWKENKLDYLKTCYSDLLPKFIGFSDDRGLYVSIYKLLIDDINSLQDEPTVGVRVAMNRYIHDEIETLDNIKSNYKRGLFG